MIWWHFAGYAQMTRFQMSWLCFSFSWWGLHDFFQNIVEIPLMFLHAICRCLPYLKKKLSFHIVKDAHKRPGALFTGPPFDIRCGDAVTIGFQELHFASKTIPVLVPFATFTFKNEAGSQWPFFAISTNWIQIFSNKSEASRACWPASHHSHTAVRAQPLNWRAQLPTGVHKIQTDVHNF